MGKGKLAIHGLIHQLWMCFPEMNCHGEVLLKKGVPTTESDTWMNEEATFDTKFLNFRIEVNCVSKHLEGKTLMMSDEELVAKDKSIQVLSGCKSLLDT